MTEPVPAEFGMRLRVNVSDLAGRDAEAGDAAVAGKAHASRQCLKYSQQAHRDKPRRVFGAAACVFMPAEARCRCCNRDRRSSASERGSDDLFSYGWMVVSDQIVVLRTAIGAA